MMMKDHFFVDSNREHNDPISHNSNIESLVVVGPLNEWVVIHIGVNWFSLMSSMDDHCFHVVMNIDALDMLFVVCLLEGCGVMRMTSFFFVVRLMNNSQLVRLIDGLVFHQ